jgi:hypothetical protein
MNRNRVIGLVLLSIFAMMQISACFVAGCKTEGVVSIFYFIVGGISCLFGIALDFLLLIIGVKVFGDVFGSMAQSLVNDKSEEDEEEDEDEEDMEVVETPE